MFSHEVRNFSFGIIDTIEDKAIPDGAASASLNWVTNGDRIELRRGFARLGLTENQGNGGILGIHIANRADGTQIAFRKRGRKLEYYDEITTDWIECGSNMFPAAAANDEASFANYFSLAGAQLFVCSPNAGPFKIMTANPGSFTDLTNASKNFQGYIKIKQNRMFLWGRVKDQTGVYGSYIDVQNYQTITGDHLGAAPGATHNLTGTLQFKNNNAVQTSFGIVVAAATSPLTATTAITQAANAQVTSTSHGLIVGDYCVFQDIVGMTQLNYRIAQIVTVVDANNFTINIDTTGFGAYSSGGNVGKAERFTDDYNGNLTSTAGGTGTINYTTGAVAVTFNGTPPSGAVFVAEEQTEDSTNNGIADFTKSGTRLAGQGFVFRQDDGGALLNVFSYGDAEYCIHQQKTWVLTLTATDTNATNLIYRENVGMPNWRAGVATGSGIFFIDTSNKTDPQIRLLTLSQFSPDVIPVSISKRLFRTRANAKGIKTAVIFGIELSTYNFDKAVVWEWGNYIVVACQSQNATTNDTVILYHKLLGSLDKCSLYVNDLATYNGTLLSGDSISDNCYTLFSGFDDDSANVNNTWDGSLSELQMADLKKAKRLRLQGAIGPDQNYEVWLSLDSADFVLIGEVSGSGSYVDRSAQVEVGANTIGSNKIGGGGDGAVAFNYYCQLPIRQDKFEKVKIRFVATALGYVSVNNYTFFNIIPMQTRIPRRYRVAA